jgi:signal transduction histidine kinase
MPAADKAPDGFVYDATEQLRHDLKSPLTTISAHTQLLARLIRRSPSLADEERVKMLASFTAIESTIQAMCAVIDTIDQTDGRR